MTTKTIGTEQWLLQAAARTLAADAVDGHDIAELFGWSEQEICELMAETVLAWREYLNELAPEPAHRG